MMAMNLNPWHILLLATAGWMNRKQAGVVEYLQVENGVLGELLGKERPRLNDDQRRRLAAKGKALGHKLLPTCYCSVPPREGVSHLDWPSPSDNQPSWPDRPSQTVVHRLGELADDGPRAILQQLRERPSIYLVESIDFLEDFALLVDDNWEWIFKEQLNGSMRDPEPWPEVLTREMFLEWSNCELSTMIWDMLKSRI